MNGQNVTVPPMTNSFAQPPGYTPCKQPSVTIKDSEPIRKENRALTKLDGNSIHYERHAERSSGVDGALPSDGFQVARGVKFAAIDHECEKCKDNQQGGKPAKRVEPSGIPD